MERPRAVDILGQPITIKQITDRLTEMWKQRPIPMAAIQELSESLSNLKEAERQYRNYRVLRREQARSLLVIDPEEDIPENDLDEVRAENEIAEARVVYQPPVLPPTLNIELPDVSDDEGVESQRLFLIRENRRNLGSESNSLSSLTPEQIAERARREVELRNIEDDRMVEPTAREPHARPLVFQREGWNEFRAQQNEREIRLLREANELRQLLNVHINGDFSNLRREVNVLQHSVNDYMRDDGPDIDSSDDDNNGEGQVAPHVIRDRPPVEWPPYRPSRPDAQINIDYDNSSWSDDENTEESEISSDEENFVDR